MSETTKLGGLDEQTTEEKVVDFNEAKKNRPLFHVWQVGDKEYKLKLKTSAIETLENKYKQGMFSLVMEDMPPLTIMLTVIFAGLRDWQHGVTFDGVKAIYDAWVDNEGGNQLDLYTKVLMPMLAVSGFFTEKQAGDIMKSIDNMDSGL